MNWFSKFAFAFTLTTVAACQQATHGPESRPSLFGLTSSSAQFSSDMTYDADQIVLMAEKFASAPSEYSREYGLTLLGQIGEISPVVARELGRIPELNDQDGITAADARAIRSIFSLVKDMTLSSDQFRVQRNLNSKKSFVMKWRSSRNNSNWEGQLIGKVIHAKPVDFEKNDGDRINSLFLRKYGILHWRSGVGLEDTDGIIVDIDEPEYKQINLKFNKTPITFNLGDALIQEIIFDEADGLDGVLRIGPLTDQPTRKSGHDSRELALVDMIMDVDITGKPYRGFSIPLQILVEGYKEGRYSDIDPLENYPGNLEFFREESKNFQGNRWKSFEYTIEMVHKPRYAEVFLSKRFRHRIGPDTYYPMSAKTAFETGSTDCKGYANFEWKALKPSGYDLSLLSMDYKHPKGHTTLILRTENGVYSFDSTAGLTGPFSSIDEIKSYHGFAGKISILETPLQMRSRFKGW